MLPWRRKQNTYECYAVTKAGLHSNIMCGGILLFYGWFACCTRVFAIFDLKDILIF